jgi:hypothetical protein
MPRAGAHRLGLSGENIADNPVFSKQPKLIDFLSDDVKLFDVIPRDSKLVDVVWRGTEISPDTRLIDLVADDVKLKGVISDDIEVADDLNLAEAISPAKFVNVLARGRWDVDRINLRHGVLAKVRVNDVVPINTSVFRSASPVNNDFSGLGDSPELKSFRQER